MINPVSPIASGEAPNVKNPFTSELGSGGFLIDNSFGEILAATSRHMTNNIANAEKLSMSALEGKAETREVVDAVMSAERSLQTAIAIRDKIVTAYLEISRMAI